MARKTKEEAERTRQQIIEAARTVFHQCGVSRATLEKVAKVAGVTRGAVYWHFKDKAELFLAVREDVFNPLLERAVSILQSSEYSDPLDAIEASIKDFFHLLDECPAMRQVYEVMMLRCEYVGEFAPVQAEVRRPTYVFLRLLSDAYQRAADLGRLRPNLDPPTAAQDTWVFVTGLLYLFLGACYEDEFKNPISEMISAHVALRRAD